MAPLRLFYDATSRTVTGMFPSFPPNTNAFLYYFTPPDKPRIAGELRLRVTSSDDPASFESGSDLLRMDGQIWSRPLCYLSKLYFHLYQKLREELLVPDDLDTALSTLLSKNPRYRRSRILYTLNDTFVADFNSSGMNFVVITEKGMAKLRTSWIFFDTREMWNCAPYTGAYTNHLLSTLLYWLFSWICRKCLGSIWTFNQPRPQRHKNRCVTISQDNHTCEMCHSPVRWPHMLSKGRRASPED